MYWHDLPLILWNERCTRYGRSVVFDRCVSYLCWHLSLYWNDRVVDTFAPFSTCFSLIISVSIYDAGDGDGIFTTWEFD
jgi:hypothetical protein